MAAEPKRVRWVVLVVFFAVPKDTASADCILENALGAPTEKVGRPEAQATAGS